MFEIPELGRRYWIDEDNRHGTARALLRGTALALVEFDVDGSKWVRWDQLHDQKDGNRART
jgi:hypothetical protein